MGQIVKHSIKSSIYSYIGAALGFLNVGLLIPKLFSPEEIGLTTYIFSVVFILSQISSLGFANVTNMIFPYFRNENKQHHGFFTLGLMASAAGAVITIILYALFHSQIVSGNDSQILIQYAYYIVPLSIANLLFNYFDIFAQMRYKASLGIFLREIVNRVGNTAAIALFFFGWVDFSGFVFWYYLSYIIPTAILAFSIYRDGDFVLKIPRRFLMKKLGRSMLRIGGFGLISGFSSIAILQIDKFMLNRMTGLSEVGIYATTFYFATMILLPSRSLKRIASVVIANAWKKNDMVTISSVYQKSIITQLAVGLFIFLGLWVNIDVIIQIIGEKFEPGKWVIFFIGIANLFEMLSGVSMNIIATSKKYFYAAAIMMLMIVLLIISNALLIPIYGIKGAAVASTMTTFIIVLIRFAFIWSHFKLQPYDWSIAKLFVFAVFSYLICLLIPQTENAYFNAVLNGSVIAITFVIPLYISKVSPDINQKLEQYYHIIFHARR